MRNFFFQIHWWWSFSLLFMDSDFICAYIFFVKWWIFFSFVIVFQWLINFDAHLMVDIKTETRSHTHTHWTYQHKHTKKKKTLGVMRVRIIFFFIFVHLKIKFSIIIVLHTHTILGVLFLINNEWFVGVYMFFFKLKLKFFIYLQIIK